MVLCNKKLQFFTGEFVSLLRGSFLVGKFYLTEVLSYNGGKVASFYQGNFRNF